MLLANLFTFAVQTRNLLNPEPEEQVELFTKGENELTRLTRS